MLLSRALSTAALLLISTISFASEDPLGEAADYELDRTRDRTTNLIKKGRVDATVVQDLPDYPAAPSYLVKVKFDLTITLKGREQGVTCLAVEKDFFTPEFMEELKVNGIYEGRDFKIKYLVTEDVSTKSGTTYPGSDKIEIYDITPPVLDGIEDPECVQSTNEIENLKIKSYVHPSIPVLGGAKIDVSGRASGFRFKAGFDYKVPAEQSQNLALVK